MTTSTRVRPLMVGHGPVDGAHHLCCPVRDLGQTGVRYCLSKGLTWEVYATSLVGQLSQARISPVPQSVARCSSRQVPLATLACFSAQPSASTEDLHPGGIGSPRAPARHPPALVPADLAARPGLAIENVVLIGDAAELQAEQCGEGPRAGPRSAAPAGQRPSAAGVPFSITASE